MINIVIDHSLATPQEIMAFEKTNPLNSYLMKTRQLGISINVRSIKKNLVDLTYENITAAATNAVMLTMEKNPTTLSMKAAMSNLSVRDIESAKHILKKMDMPDPSANDKRDFLLKHAWKPSYIF